MLPVRMPYCRDINGRKITDQDDDKYHLNTQTIRIPITPNEENLKKILKRIFSDNQKMDQNYT